MASLRHKIRPKDCLMPSCRILCYGGIDLDNIIHVPYLPTPARAATPLSERYQIGGGAGHSATWLSTWGVPVRLSGNALGDDTYGQMLYAWLEEGYPNIDLSFLTILPGGKTPYVRAMITPDGDRAMLTVNFESAPMTPLTSALLDGIEIVTANFYYNDGETYTPEAIRIAFNAGKKIVAVDIVSASQEAAFMADTIINSADVICSQFPGIDPQRHAFDLHKATGANIILTDGKDEIFAIENGGSAFTLMPPVVSVRDATGAGDAFRAGILYAMIENWTLEEAVRLAAAAGALQVQRDGSREKPSGFANVKALADTLRIVRAG